MTSWRSSGGTDRATPAARSRSSPATTTTAATTTRRRAAALAAALLITPAAGEAQEAADIGYVAGNAVIAGLTAGVSAHMRDASFWPAFRDGALGGAVSYAGRRIAVARFDGAGLIGREVGAVGASVSRNAADGVPPLSRVALPLGPVRIRVDRTAEPGRRLGLDVDLPTVVTTAWLVARDDARFDFDESLSAGVPVFDAFDRRADGNWRGEQLAGALLVRGNPDDPNPDFTRDEALAHERTHVLQYDLSAALWGEPTERWLAERLRAPWIERHFDLGLQLVPWGAANLVVPYDLRPWEREAFFLSGVDADGN